MRHDDDKHPRRVDAEGNLITVNFADQTTRSREALDGGVGEVVGSQYHVPTVLGEINEILRRREDAQSNVFRWMIGSYATALLTIDMWRYVLPDPSSPSQIFHAAGAVAVVATIVGMYRNREYLPSLPLPRFMQRY